MPAACCGVAVAAGDVVITDFGISVRHLDRLLGGVRLATSPRVDWVKLIRRTFGIGALVCAHCAGRLRLLAAITEGSRPEVRIEHFHRQADGTWQRRVAGVGERVVFESIGCELEVDRAYLEVFREGARSP